jgi:hypothetical protein
MLDEPPHEDQQQYTDEPESVPALGPREKVSQ